MKEGFLVFVCFFLFGCAEKQAKPKVVAPPPAPLIDDEDDSPDLNSDLESEVASFKLKEKYGVKDICKKINELDITFISPGSGITKDSYLVIRSLMKKYDIDIPSSALENRNIVHCSGSKQKRLENFMKAVNSEHNIIWAVRGGFGSNMLIEDLNEMPVPSAKKTFVGFSDVTSLNIFLSQKWNWRVIHAPVLIHLNDNEFSIRNFHALMNLLSEKIKKYRIPKVYPLNKIARKTREVQGPITGGNLTIVEGSLGTCWEIQTDGKILFVEDIDVTPWRIYRSLYHLQESGKLAKAKALVLGRFAKCGAQKDVVNMLFHFSKSLSIPVYLTDQIGHGNHNMPVVYNAIAMLHESSLDLDLTEMTDEPETSAMNEDSVHPEQKTS